MAIALMPSIVNGKQSYNENATMQMQLSIVRVIESEPFIDKTVPSNIVQILLNNTNKLFLKNSFDSTLNNINPSVLNISDSIGNYAINVYNSQGTIAANVTASNNLPVGNAEIQIADDGYVVIVKINESMCLYMQSDGEVYRK